MSARGYLSKEGRGFYFVSKILFAGKHPSFHQCLVSAVKKASKSTAKPALERLVEVSFADTPKEFLSFNRCLVESVGDFVLIGLTYADASGAIAPVFRGMIWKTDLSIQIKELQDYLTRIGGPQSERGKYQLPLNIVATAPVAINRIDCASRAGWAEIVIRQFSHKVAMDHKHSENEKTSIPGVTHGVYTSDIETHRILIYELIMSVTA